MKNHKPAPIKHTPSISYRREFILLFSNKKSLFSSKKIERTIVFFVFLIITLIYLWFNIKTLRALEFVEVIGLWLAYGGYNSLMGYRDKKLDNNGFNDYDYNSYNQPYQNTTPPNWHQNQHISMDQGNQGYGNQFRNDTQENDPNNPENQGD